MILSILLIAAAAAVAGLVVAARPSGRPALAVAVTYVAATAYVLYSHQPVAIAAELVIGVGIAVMFLAIRHREAA